MAEETTATRQRRLNARLRFAHFPARRTLEDFDFSFQLSLDPKVIWDLADLGFVEAGTPVLLLGKPGCGKSHLAIALGIRAVEAGPAGVAELFGGDTVVAAAILDRLLDQAAVINIKGPSWRLREHQALTQPLAQLNDPAETTRRRR